VFENSRMTKTIVQQQQQDRMDETGVVGEIGSS